MTIQSRKTKRRALGILKQSVFGACVVALTLFAASKTESLQQKFCPKETRVEERASRSSGMPERPSTAVAVVRPAAPKMIRVAHHTMARKHLKVASVKHSHRHLAKHSKKSLSRYAQAKARHSKHVAKAKPQVLDFTQ